MLTNASAIPNIRYKERIRHCSIRLAHGIVIVGYEKVTILSEKEAPPEHSGHPRSWRGVDARRWLPAHPRRPHLPGPGQGPPRLVLRLDGLQRKTKRHSRHRPADGRQGKPPGYLPGPPHRYPHQVSQPRPDGERS